MPWRGRRGKWCHGCDKHVSEVGPLSARYRCASCGEGALLDNNEQLREHAGPRFDHWRKQTLAAFGVLPVETPPDEA